MKCGIAFVLTLAVIGVALICGRVKREKPEMVVQPSPTARAWASIDTSRPDMRCNATWYDFPEAGRPTASREIFNPNKLTCAINRQFLSRVPFGSYLLLRNPLNRHLVLVRVNDAMPDSVRVIRKGKRVWVNYIREGKFIDVARAAADSLGMVRAGVMPVEVWLISRPIPPLRDSIMVDRRYPVLIKAIK